MSHVDILGNLSGKMFSSANIKKRTKPKIAMEKLHPWIGQLKGSLKDMVGYDNISLESLVRWLKKLESSMSMEAAKLRNKPNRATKIVTVLRGLMASFKLLTFQMKNDDILKLYPTFSLIIQYYLNLVFKSTMRSKKRNDQIALDVYCFVKLMLHESPEYILDALLTSSAVLCATSESFECMVLKLVILDKFLYDKTSSSLLKYLGVVALLKECGCDIGEFRETIRRYNHTPSDFADYVRAVPVIKFKTGESISLQGVAERVRSRAVIQRCTERLYVISFDNLNGRDEGSESDDTVSMMGDDDAEVSSTNPALDISVIPNGSYSDSDSDDDFQLKDLECEDLENEDLEDIVLCSDNGGRDPSDFFSNSNKNTTNTSDLDSDLDQDDDEDVGSSGNNNFHAISFKPSSSSALSRIDEGDSDDSDIGIVEVVINKPLDGDEMTTDDPMDRLESLRYGSNVRDEADPSSDEAEQYVPTYTSNESADNSDNVPTYTSNESADNSDIPEDIESESFSAAIESTYEAPVSLENMGEETVVDEANDEQLELSTTSSQNNEEMPVPSDETICTRLRRRPQSTAGNRTESDGNVQVTEQGKSTKTPKRQKTEVSTTTPVTRARRSLAAAVVANADTVKMPPKNTQGKVRKETIAEGRKSSRPTQANTPNGKKGKVVTPKSSSKRGKRK